MSHSRWASSSTTSNQQATSTFHTHTHTKRNLNACLSYFPLTILITVSYKICTSVVLLIQVLFTLKKNITVLYERAEISLPIII